MLSLIDFMAEPLVHCLDLLFLETGNAGVGELFVQLFQGKEGSCRITSYNVCYTKLLRDGTAGW